MTHRMTAIRPSHAPGENARGVSRAFTLIELIAVMAILAILAAVVTPASLTMTTGRHAAAMRAVVRDLGYARARAMATGATTWVVFTVSTDSYAVLAENPSNPGFSNASTITDPATGTPMVIRLNTGEYAGTDLLSASFASNSRIGFDRRGRPLGSAGTVLSSDGSITLSGSKQVTIATPTGRIAGN